MQDWQRNLLTYSLGGAGVGALGSLVLNALYHARKNRMEADDLVPRSIVERPFFVDPAQAETLQNAGIGVKSPRPLSKTAGYRGILKIARKVATTEPRAALPKLGEANWLVRSFRDIGLPLAGGLGAGYLAFNGIDRLVDSMYKDRAKRDYEAKKKKLEALMGQMYGGLSKAADDHLDNGNFADVFTEIMSMRDLVKTAEDRGFFGRIADTPGHIGDWFGSTFGSMVGSPAGEYAKYAIGIPLLLGMATGVPAAISAFGDDDKNAKALKDIEQYYRDLPYNPRIRMVPTLRSEGRRDLEHRVA